MALFKLRHGDSNGETVVYFTPVAAKLCRAELGDLSFETCDAPQRSLVSMIAGHMSARDLLVDP